MSASPRSGFRTLVADSSWSNLSPQERLEAICTVSAQDDTHFYSRFMKEHLLSASVTETNPKTSKGVFRFRVDSFYCNTLNNLHGGAQSTIYDILTSIFSSSVLDVPSARGSVSRTLNVSYLRPAPEGCVIVCEVEVTQAGKSLSLLRGTMKRETDGAIVSTCEHHKASIPMPTAKI